LSYPLLVILSGAEQKTAYLLPFIDLNQGRLAGIAAPFYRRFTGTFRKPLGNHFERTICPGGPFPA
jgi:hypothetical protein